MKKILLGLALSLSLFPLTASAGLIGTGSLTLAAFYHRLLYWLAWISTAETCNADSPQ